MLQQTIRAVCCNVMSVHLFATIGMIIPTIDTIINIIVVVSCNCYKMGPLRFEKDCWRIIRPCTACDVILCQSKTTESVGGGEDNYLVVRSVLKNNRTGKNLRTDHR